MIQVKRYVWDKDISLPASSTELHIQVHRNTGDIIDGNLLGMQPDTYTAVHPTDDYEHTREWSVKVAKGTAKVRVSLSLGVSQTSPLLNQNDLQTIYWICSKEE